MVDFYETANFIVSAHDKPHVTRLDGGHIKIIPKREVESRWDFNPDEAKEFVRLSMIVGEAMKKGLNRQGIPVKRINFQDNGNWAFIKNSKPSFHLHLYGRAKNSKNQEFGQGLTFPPYNSNFYNTTKSLNKKDIQEIKKLIILISKREKYSLDKW